MMERLRRRLPTPESIRTTWLYPWMGEKLMDPIFWVPTRHSLSLGVALGWFIGLLPIFGFQIALVLLLGSYARCHLPAAVMGTFITNPLTVPAILVLQYQVGDRICRLCRLGPLPGSFDLATLAQHGLPLAIGGVLSALAAGLAGYVCVWVFWGWKERSLVNGVA